MRPIALVATVVGCAAATGAPPSLGTQPTRDERCGVYAAVITHVTGDSTRPVVIYDSTSLGVPRFAFRAFTGLGPQKADTGFVITDSLLALQRADNRERIPLPECIAASRRVTRLQFDSLRASFMSGRGGWEAFNAAYPDARGFLMASRVTWLSPDSSQALVYVAEASAPLSGGGSVLYLRRNGSRWRVQSVRRVWAS